jgi:hypothetical protein
MYRFLRDKWDYTYGSFHGSEVLIWSRFQVAFGSIWLAVSQSDLSPFISNPKFLSGWLIFNGFVTEYLRRRRAEDFHEDREGGKDA